MFKETSSLGEWDIVVSRDDHVLLNTQPESDTSLKFPS